MDELDKRFYKISEVADIIGLPCSTLRYWEKQFTLIKPRRTRHSTRMYTPADIEVIRMIHYLVKEKGMHLDAAEDEIRRNRSGITRRYEAIRRLREVRDKLAVLETALRFRISDFRRDAREERDRRLAQAAAPKVAPQVVEVTAQPVPAPAPAPDPEDQPQAAKTPSGRRHKKKDYPDLPSLF